MFFFIKQATVYGTETTKTRINHKEKRQKTWTTKAQRSELEEKVQETARLAVDAAFQVHSILGPGLIIKDRINSIII